MKKAILVISMLFCVGCSRDTQAGFGRIIQRLAQSANSASLQMEQEKQQSQQSNSTYWQEKNAEQQYFDNIGKPPR